MSIDIRDNPAAHRYEITEDGTRAGLVEYEITGDTITFVHTEVDPAFGGRGLAGQLVAAALADARHRDLSVLPECPYVRKVIADHPDAYLDLVPADARARYGLPAE
ncbi:GNAT family N-acetyltransferase [Nocardia sp. alder85J]|uniref:GNAT family N-acetyltransferase n=1 Tax=Nocardia sp. alder85J TaxID=2862949 RepID=UPI001CD81994|nr:GNAT family N-acetyltransferase [Nocardia sp. alder85J]MCX4094938.1 GNAT family N-acetyltransferase [Nocardia sp. alder85J]